MARFRTAVVIVLGAVLIAGCGVMPFGDKLAAVDAWSPSFETAIDGTTMTLTADDWPTIAPAVAVCTAEPASVFAESPDDRLTMYDDPACAGSAATSAIDAAGSLVITIDGAALPARYAGVDPWTLVIAHVERNGRASFVLPIPAPVQAG